uniref:Uncharacterized protein n=1 Tax=Glossina austeni TaxID=7395 RepID=A0A1A9US18_GLOAU
MHLKSKIQTDSFVDNRPAYHLTETMASSLINDDEDNGGSTHTRSTQQQQHQQQNSNNNLESGKLVENDSKFKKQTLEQRKQELEKLLDEKSWLLQQIQKQETQILNGTFEYMNLNDLIQSLATQYKQEQQQTTTQQDTATGGQNEELAILRRKSLTTKENQLNNNVNYNNAFHRQSEISNRSSEYDNFPSVDMQSTHSAGTKIGNSLTQATQQYPSKTAIKKRSSTVAGSTLQAVGNLQAFRQQQQHHLEQQQILLTQQQQQYTQQKHQHIIKQQQHFLEHHQVLVPHLQYATQKFYYTTLQPQLQLSVQHNNLTQYGRYLPQQSQSQQLLVQKPQAQQYVSPPSVMCHGLDNISLYSINSANVATLHRQPQHQPIIVQCDKYYLSPTTHANHQDGGGFIKSSQNIKEYVSPATGHHHSPQSVQIRDKARLTSNCQVMNRVTPSLDVISLTPSYVSMEEIDYTTANAISGTNNASTSNSVRWRSQSNLPPVAATETNKSHSNDMLNNNQYYNTALNPPPSTLSSSTQFTKCHKQLDDVTSINSYSTDTQKKSQKSKQWLESSLDGPVIRNSHSQQPHHHNHNNNEDYSVTCRSKLSSHSLNTTPRHYSMSAAANQRNPLNSNNVSLTNATNSKLGNEDDLRYCKLSQSTSYLNHMDVLGLSANSVLTNNLPTAYKYLKQSKSTLPTSVLYVNTNNNNGQLNNNTANVSSSVTANTLSPDIRIESPKNVTIVQPATFQPYKEVTKPFEMSDFYKYSTKFRQKENNTDAN